MVEIVPALDRVERRLAILISCLSLFGLAAFIRKAGLSIIFITLLTVSFQAINAAVSNPVKSLKAE
jgi:hypothetical protein